MDLLQNKISSQIQDLELQTSVGNFRKLHRLAKYNEEKKQHNRNVFLYRTFIKSSK